jgi:type II secretory pathway component PulL
MFLKLHSLTVQRAYLRSETADIAAKVFPSESSAGNTSPQVVLARLEDLLKDERKAQGALSALAGTVPLPLEALQRIDARTPPGVRVKITELSVSERSVRVAGTTDSYKDFEELRKQFESAPEFENVTFTNPEGLRNAQSIRFVAAFYLRAEKDG